ncbi:capsular biosynthesis protein [Hymenobacter gummosus]|uniref:protein-tyrosine-phosphatase n=1 Tax=Hymenobacter gummosus TaxID=1776032 RepID=A0A431U905_9BACT|nr:CpsB/CapC family capsule biosynthesis tyrosine phosphatase [Hymenobacter gummosus]RTQ53342.1 capsular biosynthesis protein [Hymenobacter gummosus]
MASFLQRLFGRSEPVAAASLAPLRTDMHSHLLPGLDDGAETLEHSVALLRTMHELGYRKLIMTPHIMGDFYRNTPEGVRGALAQVQQAAAEAGLHELELDCAAEYYLDEFFVRRLETGEELLSFGGEKKYVLFETSYINEPFNLQEVVFGLRSAGYTPVLAHPERYTYLYGRFAELEKVRENGALLQVNLNSLVGYYSGGAKRVAEKLIDGGLVDFAGTDAHNLKHTNSLQRVLQSEYLPKLLRLPLRNGEL